MFHPGRGLLPPSIQTRAAPVAVGWCTAIRATYPADGRNRSPAHGTRLQRRGCSMDARGPAVVIGGASGIGAAVAARLRATRATVVVWDRQEPADITCDIADPMQIDAAVQATVDRVGVPTQVTVSAGIGHSGPLAEAGPDEWDRVMAVNARGVWLAMRGLGRAMVGAGQGSIVAVEQRELAAGRRHHGPVLRVEGRARHGGEGGGRRVGAGTGERGGARCHRHPDARARPPHRAVALGCGRSHRARSDRPRRRHRRGRSWPCTRWPG